MEHLKARVADRERRWMRKNLTSSEPRTRPVPQEGQHGYSINSLGKSPKIPVCRLILRRFCADLAADLVADLLLNQWNVVDMKHVRAWQGRVQVQSCKKITWVCHSCRGVRRSLCRAVWKKMVGLIDQPAFQLGNNGPRPRNGPKLCPNSTGIWRKVCRWPFSVLRVLT